MKRLKSSELRDFTEGPSTHLLPKEERQIIKPGVRRPMTRSSGDTELGMRLLLCKSAIACCRGVPNGVCVKKGASHGSWLLRNICFLCPRCFCIYSHTQGCLSALYGFKSCLSHFASLPKSMYLLLPFACACAPVSGNQYGLGSQHCRLAQEIHSAWRLVHVKAAGISSVILSSQLTCLC